MDDPSDLNDVSEPDDAPAIPAEPAPPIESRFLFVDVAALRAKQLRRGARLRFDGDEGAAAAQSRSGWRWKKCGAGWCTTTCPTRSWRRGRKAKHECCGRVVSSRSAPLQGLGVEHGLRARAVHRLLRRRRVHQDEEDRRRRRVVVKSLDERISHRPMVYLVPSAPRGPADQLRSPELLEKLQLCPARSSRPALTTDLPSQFVKPRSPAASASRG